MNSAPLDTLSRFLIGAGLILAGAGALLYLISRIPGQLGQTAIRGVSKLALAIGLGIGKLPGDIFIQKGNFSFYFPVVTCVLLSLVLTLVFNFFKKP